MSVSDSILDQPLVFVDIETNGLSHTHGRVIEVAAIRVENGSTVRKFSSLIDPGSELPPYITSLTGITNADVHRAPAFSQIAEELYDILHQATFVAHNVRFDYSFLKQEFKRLNRPFLPRQLCTVKLSRALYPHEKSHKLKSLIARHNFMYVNRHRAYDDADILRQFVEYVRYNFPPEQVASAVGRQLRQPAIPKGLAPELIGNLPEAPGVYIFEDESGQPLYIGKSINIKKRVLSHFGRDHAEHREFKIAQAVRHIRTEQTTGELSALLRESQLIKELQPVYNRKLRRLSKLLLAKQHFTDQGYVALQLEEAELINPDETASILAVYPRRGGAKESLTVLTKTFDLCPKLMGLEKGNGPCFLYQLHKCRGACAGQEPAAAYNQRLLTAFEHQRIHAWPYNGPVLVQESSDDGVVNGIIVDKWCVLGELAQEPYCEPVCSWSEKLFDLDTYKILRSCLTHKLAGLTVQPLSPQQLAHFSM